MKAIIGLILLCIILYASISNNNLAKDRKTRESKISINHHYPELQKLFLRTVFNEKTLEKFIHEQDCYLNNWIGQILYILPPESGNLFVILKIAGSDINVSNLASFGRGLTTKHLRTAALPNLNYFSVGEYIRFSGYVDLPQTDHKTSTRTDTVIPFSLSADFTELFVLEETNLLGK